MLAMVSRSTDAPVPLGEYVPEADSLIVMGGMSWDAYESLLDHRGERSRPRLAYLDGVLQIMSPSYKHEIIASMIRHLVAAYGSERGIPWTDIGSWTLKNRLKRAGVEPDDCFIFGRHPRRKRRPDLAIEVVWTSGGIDKLEIYRRLGVPEVWYWIDDKITIYRLGRKGYAAHDQSAFVPGIDLELICKLVPIVPTSDAIAQFRATLHRG